MRTTRTLIVVIAAAATWSSATAVWAEDAAADQRSSCLQVIAGAFGDKGRDDQRALLQAIAAQLHMPSDQLTKTLAESHGSVNECFNRLTARAR